RPRFLSPQLLFPYRYPPPLYLYPLANKKSTTDVPSLTTKAPTIKYSSSTFTYPCSPPYPYGPSPYRSYGVPPSFTPPFGGPSPYGVRPPFYPHVGIIVL